jgi:hypothetical protein
MNEHYSPEPSALTMFGLYAWIFLLYVIPFLLVMGVIVYGMWKVLTDKDISWQLKCVALGLFLLVFGYWGLALFLS